LCKIGSHQIYLIHYGRSGSSVINQQRGRCNTVGLQAGCIYFL